ncbi:hypothetical protein DFS33DRAFT_1272237 [Desarmillaria ectypa]|nr:hypothetical protein DFS33DRAFT_1272237 [Desarmillaria ectypa]
MDNTQLPTVTIADPPFHDTSNFADLVIRTTDNVDFFVLKALLSLNSPSSFFRHALQASHHTEERDGFPVLEVNEDSSTFRTILFFCYPYKVPEIENFEQFMKVGMALEKYCIDNASERFFEVVLASSVIKEQPVRVFSMAVAHGWKDLAKTAARNTLAVSLEPEVEFEELKHINALQHLRLRAYHRNCENAVRDLYIRRVLGTEMLWLGGHSSAGLEFVWDHGSCKWCRKPLSLSIQIVQGHIHQTHRWLGDYLDSVGAHALQRPWPDIALDEDIILQTIAASTSECGSDKWAKIAASQIRLLGKRLAEEMNKRISEVPLNVE